MKTNPNNYVEQVDGTKMWHKNGKLHREDGPAIEEADGTKIWYQNGLRHREDGPAVERASGTKMWYKNGLRHRDGGPAIERADGTKSWWKNGQCHRDGGPAIEWADGAKEWWKNGQIHREDGPAYERADGTKEWYLNSTYYEKEEEYWKVMAKCKKEKPFRVCTVCPDCLAENVELTYCAVKRYEICLKCFQKQFETSVNTYVDHPKHYGNHPFCECIDIVEHMNFNLGNAVKYIWRAGQKGNKVEDLNKAKWYIEREIERIKKYESK